jgi:hypothetical protein
MQRLNKTPHMLGNRPPIPCRGATVAVCIAIGTAALGGGGPFLAKLFEALGRDSGDAGQRTAPGDK